MQNHSVSNIIKKEYPFQKWMLPSKFSYLSMRGASPVGQTGGALFFSLVILISVEKGKKRDNQAAGRHQQGQYPDEDRNDLISHHKRHLPSYVEYSRKLAALENTAFPEHSVFSSPPLFSGFLTCFLYFHQEILKYLLTNLPVCAAAFID